MAASSARIDELRKKFDENPRRYFAPLANEYRKAGDLEQAIFICQEYLPQQPGHMSGHIVYGQALFELGRFDEARTVFETALSLDPENLIALRHLGDIARQGGDLDVARGWYQRVLEADPRNEEITQIMLDLLGADIGTSPQSAAPAELPEAPAAPAEPAAPGAPAASSSSAAVAAVDDVGATPLASATIPPPLPSEVSPPVPLPAAPSLPPPLPEPESFRSRHAPDEEDLLDLDVFGVGGVPLGSAASNAATRTTSEVEQSQEVTLDTSRESSAAPNRPTDFDLSAPPEPPIEMAADLDIGLPDDGMASTTPAGGDLPVDGLETFEAGVVGLASVPASTVDTESFFDIPAATEPSPPASSSTVALTTSAPGASDEPAAEPPAAFVTETMAELYLRQGHLESALDIYRRLVELRPDDATLQAKLDEVEQRVFGAPASAASAASAASPASAPAPTTSAEPVVSATPSSYGGPTIREYLTGLFIRRGAPVAPVEATPALVDTVRAADEAPADNQASAFDDVALEAFDFSDGASAPAVPAADLRPTPGLTHTVSDSLDVFFGGPDAAEPDDQGANTLAEAFAPESPDSTPLEGVPAHRASNELSLDHVFKGGGPPPSDSDGFSFDQFFSAEGAESAEANAEGTEGASGAAGTSPEATDDIAQFNAWLNGLKKT